MSLIELSNHSGWMILDVVKLPVESFDDFEPVVEICVDVEHWAKIGDVELLSWNYR